MARITIDEVGEISSEERTFPEICSNPDCRWDLREPGTMRVRKYVDTLHAAHVKDDGTVECEGIEREYEGDEDIVFAAICNGCGWPVVEGSDPRWGVVLDPTTRRL